jgi:hypothetical protein
VKVSPLPAKGALRPLGHSPVQGRPETLLHGGNALARRPKAAPVRAKGFDVPTHKPALPEALSPVEAHSGGNGADPSSAFKE